MKKFLLSMMLCMPMILAAQNGVTVSGLAINAGTVTFNVRWNRDAMPVALWSDTVWVFVDYNNAGRMERLPLSTGATLTATSAPGVGKVVEETGNNKGVWVVGNARTNGSFSATVQLLTSVNDVGGACVYGSNYPPVGEYISPTEISFTGTPVYEISLIHPDKGSAAVKSGDTFLLPCDYTLTSFTDATGAPGIMKCIPPATYTLSVSTSAFCAGSEDVQFSLSGTEAERSYQLYRNNSEVGAVLNGTGSAATFTGSFNVAGTYTAAVIADGVYCAWPMNGTHTISVNPSPTITLTSNNASQTVKLGDGITAIQYTTENTTDASVSGLPSGVTGSWSSNIYTISGTVVSTAVQIYNYTVTITNSNGCNATATGTITVENIADFPVTLCTACCWSGSTWVDCYVTTNVYPFDNNTTNTAVVWSGNGNTFYAGASGSEAKKNGRANTAAIVSQGTSAVQICKNLGNGWYLPAAMELYAMGCNNPSTSSNNLTGACLSQTGENWSSTESRYYWPSGSYCDERWDTTAVTFDFAAADNGCRYKTDSNNFYVRCVWQKN
jgi:hypothetical protein